jgi:hypothetical protein
MPDIFFVLTILRVSPAVLPVYVGAYSHRYFVRGNRKLCHLITRTPNSASMLRSRSPGVMRLVSSRAEFKSEEGKESVVEASPRAHISSSTTRTIQNLHFHSNSNFHSSLPFTESEDVDDNHRWGISIALPFEWGEPRSQVGADAVSSSEAPRLQNRSWLQNHEQQLSEYASQLVGPRPAKKIDDTYSSLENNLNAGREIADEIITTFR